MRESFEFFYSRDNFIGITSTKLLPILACRPQIRLPTYTLTELFARPLGAARTYLPTKSASRGLYYAGRATYLPTKSASRGQPLAARPTSNLPTYQKRVARPLAAYLKPTYLQNRVARPLAARPTYLRKVLGCLDLRRLKKNVTQASR